MTSMKYLGKREDIIIRKADKNGAVVIVDVKDYIIKAKRPLSNNRNTIETIDTIEIFKKQKLINEKVTEGPKRNDPNTPKFYLRRKINNEGIKAVKEYCEKYKEKTVPTKITIPFLILILTLNNFLFNCTHYLQTMGCLMAKTCVPSYSNIIMVNFEAKYIYPYIKEMFRLYFRYIDDMLMIWKDTKAKLTSKFHQKN